MGEVQTVPRALGVTRPLTPLPCSQGARGELAGARRPVKTRALLRHGPSPRPPHRRCRVGGGAAAGRGRRRCPGAPVPSLLAAVLPAIVPSRPVGRLSRRTLRAGPRGRSAPCRDTAPVCLESTWLVGRACLGVRWLPCCALPAEPTRCVLDGPRVPRAAWLPVRQRLCGPPPRLHVSCGFRPDPPAPCLCAGTDPGVSAFAPTAPPPRRSALRGASVDPESLRRVLAPSRSKEFFAHPLLPCLPFPVLGCRLRRDSQDDVRRGRLLVPGLSGKAPRPNERSAGRGLCRRVPVRAGPLLPRLLRVLVTSGCGFCRLLLSVQCCAHESFTCRLDGRQGLVSRRWASFASPGPACKFRPVLGSVC